MKKLLLCSAIAASSLVVASPSFSGSNTADENYTATSSKLAGWYVGVGVNHDSRTDWSGSATLSGTSYDYDYSMSDQDYGYNIIIGKQVSKVVGFEYYFSKIGDMSMTSKSGNQTSKFDSMYASGLSALLRYNICKRLDIYGKGGVSYFRGDYSNSTETESDKFFAPTLGLGLEFNVNDKFSIRADYTRYYENGNSDNDPVDTGYVPDLMGINFMYHFS